MTQPLSISSNLFHCTGKPWLSGSNGTDRSSDSLRRKAVFLDKDGTLIKDIPYNVDPDQIELSDGAVLGLQLLHAAQYPLIVITNQSGVAHGYFPETALLAVEQRLNALLAAIGVPLSGFYYCPHHPKGRIVSYAVDCVCRKPYPGLLYHAAHDHGIDLTQSWLIGDILHDVEAGRTAGCRTLLINNGNETEWQLSPRRIPHHLVNDLTEAARVILAIDCPNDHVPTFFGTLNDVERFKKGWRSERDLKPQ